MRDEFGFDAIRSVEFCVSAEDGDSQTNYLVPSDRRVQDALRGMLSDTVRSYEGADQSARPLELSEKYGPTESLVADLATPEMATVRAIYDEEGWPSNPGVLQNPAQIAYYFAVFRDQANRKLLGVRRAAQFKGVVHSRLIKLFDDSLTMVDDHLFRLDHEFDFLVAQRHVFIIHPIGFERVAEVEALVSAKAREKALALGNRITFADFAVVAEYVETHKRAARLVAALSSRDGLNDIKKIKFVAAAKDTDVKLEKAGHKIRPAPGSELAFLELLDARRYATSLKTGPKEAYVASSRSPVWRAVPREN